MDDYDMPRWLGRAAAAATLLMLTVAGLAAGAWLVYQIVGDFTWYWR